MTMRLHPVWEKDAEEIVRRAMRVAGDGYIFWVGLYFLLTLASIGLPTAATIFRDYSAFLAGGGAVAAALLAVFRPHENASN